MKTNNFRHFGPISDADARDLVERMLDDESTKGTLLAFLSGDIEADKMAWELQVIAANIDESINPPPRAA